MLIYQGTKKDFMDDVRTHAIQEKLTATLEEKMHRHTGTAELHSWMNSLPQMYMVLDDPSIPSSCGIAIEYNVPLTSKRIDFIISGVDDNGTSHADIIELKQWEHAEEIRGLDGVVGVTCDPQVITFTGGAYRTVAHPSYQAWSYAEAIRDFNASVQDKKIELHPCAYLHNYDTSGSCALKAETYVPYLERAPLFGKQDSNELASFIKAHITRGDNEEVLFDIDNGRISPSKSLQDSLASMLEGNPEFVLLDDQKVVYERALDYALSSKTDGKKRVYIVRGGPGTGKSVVAINLLVALINQDVLAQYATQNSAPRAVYKAKLTAGHTRSVDSLFRSPQTVWQAKANSIGCLLVDEAHRLIHRSQYQSSVDLRSEIQAIVDASRCSVFFIDESQRVLFKDEGTVGRIKAAAKAAGALVYEDDLTSQFRCNGSDGYLSWLDDVLQIHETGNWELDDVGYDFEVFDDPSSLQTAIAEKNAGNNSRIVAGYCWNWEKGHRNNPYAHDITIGDWSMSWNLETGVYAIDPGSIEQAGCIHTVQGLEFDYVGVIVGPDMRFENGTIVTDPSKRAKTDASLNGYKKLKKTNPEQADAIADEIIRNTYRTLMTRGQKGCYVYCTDEPLRDYFKGRIEDYMLELDRNRNLVNVVSKG